MPFYQICGDVGDNARPQGFDEGEVHLYGKPCCTECVAYGGAEEHTEQRQIPFVSETLNEEACDQRQKQIAEQIPAGGPQQFTDPACETRENRQTDQTEAEIDDAAEKAFCHA